MAMAKQPEYVWTIIFRPHFKSGFIGNKRSLTLLAPADVKAVLSEVRDQVRLIFVGPHSPVKDIEVHELSRGAELGVARELP
jgi:hypothetical protein